MAQKTKAELLAQIAADIKQNGIGSITGNLLGTTLKDMVDSANGIVTNRQTSQYTLALSDVNKLVEMNSTEEAGIVVQLNADVPFPIGTQILVSQYGTGSTSILQIAGVTVRSVGGVKQLAGQYSVATLIKIAADEWYLFGGLAV